MRNILVAGILLLLAGCQNLVGPFQAQTPMRVDDPAYTIGEQQRWGRAKLALPDDSPMVLPPVGLPRPGSWGTTLR
jgi:hypothetical protein